MWIRSSITNAPIWLPIDVPRLTRPPTSSGSWAWVEAIDPYASIVPPPMATIHPLEEHDPRLAAIARGRRVAVPARSFALVAPRMVRNSARPRLRGRVAVSLVGGSSWKSGTPDLWLDGEPLAYLETLAHSPYRWVQRWTEDKPVWFTSDGGDLWRLVRVARRRDGDLVVELEAVSCLR
jgi:hypothetical protein